MKLSTVILIALPGSFTLAQQSEPAAPRELRELLDSSDMLSTFTAALKNHTKLFDRLTNGKNFTILAPTNDAFGKWQDENKFNVTDNVDDLNLLLGYHVLDGVYHDGAFGETTQFLPTLLGDSGETGVEAHRNLTGRQQVVRVGRNNVTRAVSLTNGDGKFVNINGTAWEFSGGVLHLLNGVLHPPATLSRTLEDTQKSEMLGYLQTTGLKDMLDHLARVTVFVPSNTAFTNLSKTLDTYTTSALRDVLSYHVIPNFLEYSPKLANNTKLKTLQGREVTLRIVDDALWVNGAKVGGRDVIVGNGVVHVLEGVLNPANTEDAPGGTEAWEASGTVIVVPGETDLTKPKTAGVGKAGVSFGAVAFALLAAFV